jgi:hypothetical protein
MNPMTAMARPSPAGREAGEDSDRDDPLVELARIVAGRANASAGGADHGSEDMTVENLARDLEADLEAELYADLQSTFSDEGARGGPYPEQRDSRAFDRQTRERNTARPPPAEPLDQPRAAADLPPLPRARQTPDFSSFNLRNEKGPAYNPSALSAGDSEAAYRPQSRQESGADMFDEEEPLLDQEPTGRQQDASEYEDYDDQDDWDLDPHPHVAEVAAGAAEPAYLDQADAYQRDDSPQVRAPRSPARHRDPRLDRDPLGEARYQRSGGRRLYPLLGVILIIALGAVGVLVLRNGGGAPDPVLVAADPSPTRVFPEPEPANPDNLVFNRINPDTPAPEENLLPLVEAPADLGAAPDANDGITQILTPADPGAGIDPAAAADLPRMVRTVTVLPDGTIIGHETTPADGEAAGAAPAAGAALPDPVVANAPPAPAPLTPEPAPADPIAAVVNNPAAAAAAAPEPVPLIERPAAEAQPLLLTPAAPAPDQVANLPRVGDPIAPGFYVQVSSQRSEQAAQTQLAALRGQAPSLLGDRPAIIQRIELPERGVFFRVQFGPFSGADAQSLLQSLGEVGIDAFVMNH